MDIPRVPGKHCADDQKDDPINEASEFPAGVNVAGWRHETIVCKSRGVAENGLGESRLTPRISEREVDANIAFAAPFRKLCSARVEWKGRSCEFLHDLPLKRIFPKALCNTA